MLTGRKTWKKKKQAIKSAKETIDEEKKTKKTGMVLVKKKNK